MDPKLNSTCSDAEDFVESVMVSQRVSKVNTPVHNGRKRNISDSAILPLSTKKPKVTKPTRRNLYDPASPSTSDVIVTNADVHVDGNSSVEHLITKLSLDMHMLFNSIKERMDKLETGLEQRIATKVSQILDKRINSELHRIRKDVDGRLDAFRESVRTDVTTDLNELKTKVDDFISNSNDRRCEGDDITLNVIIRDLPETTGENTLNKVNTLIKDGLKLRDVKCISANRKKSSNEGKPGVIVARFNSHDDKRQIMLHKQKLRDSSRYSRVFIFHDQSQADRLISSNFLTIYSALKNHGLSVRGTRVIR
jgi:hypothetical protein